jgi:hypothetical protein
MDEYFIFLSGALKRKSALPRLVQLSRIVYLLFILGMALPADDKGSGLYRDEDQDVQVVPVLARYRLRSST